MIHLKKLNVNYLLMANMIADKLIKLLSSQKHRDFIKQLSLMNVENLIDQ
jgi:hypothetical protein